MENEWAVSNCEELEGKWVYNGKIWLQKYIIGFSIKNDLSRVKKDSNQIKKKILCTVLKWYKIKISVTKKFCWNLGFYVLSVATFVL